MSIASTGPTAPDTHPAADIRGWLVERIAFYLECPREEIDEGAPLVDIGLDSVYALTLCGDVEDHFGLLVEPTMAWDHPTVDAITAHLTEELARR
ncbi:acyl carrier protein [Streptomyces griseorubiginosus]|uniref:acyl carrier protein n=1 Tax=Streptomyces griseorubiginosus TaxID=67304 RepID=UPI002E804D2B|nr:acyl carrier protein [Streptomyces griseorubiginosus]WUB45423.1 acyl carrier protein [Streptomyces griseorubiginosus]WUB53941.1 acyl carrier protein [Streptomyces griseorubiginosus]